MLTAPISAAPPVNEQFWRSQEQLLAEEYRLPACKPAGASNGIGTVTVRPDDADLRMIYKISRGADPEVFILLLSALYQLLYRYNGNTGISIHTPAFLPETYENAMIPLVAAPLPADTVKEWIMKVNMLVTSSMRFRYHLGAEEHQAGKGKLGTNVLFRYDALQAPVPADEAYDLVVNVEKGAHADLTGLTIRLQYNGSCFEDWFVTQLAAHYCKILSAFQQPGQTWQQVKLLPAQEEEKLLFTFNDNSRTFAAGNNIITLFRQQAVLRPSALAVKDNERRITYAELDAYSDKLAYALQQQHGIGPRDVVAVMLDRSCWMPVAIMGILKAGAAYLPVDPAYPPERINYMLSNAGARLLVLQTAYLFAVPDFAGSLLALDAELDGYALPSEPLNVNTGSADPAYIIYTSGSTGLPKGVIVSHGALMNTESWRKEYYGFDENFLTLQIASFSFDSAVNDIFSMLLWGGGLIILNEQERIDVSRIRYYLENDPVTNFNIVPSMYRNIIDDLHAEKISLRMVTLAGEQLTEDLMLAHFSKFPQVRIINEYGPAENAICSTACTIVHKDALDYSIGKPINNVQVYILGNEQQLLPIGVAGEIVLGGKGLADGYINNKTLTDQRFINHPFNAGQKVYLTGDMGRWLPDGSIEFLGRKDQQVKIRGYRVEPDEVSLALRRHPDVKDAAVIPYAPLGQVKELLAYITLTDPAVPPAVTGLKTFLGKHLPAYMTPARFIVLKEIPLSVNGKLDKKALPLPEAADVLHSGSVAAPETGMETLLADIWKEVLNRTDISIFDDFFVAGGDSIKAIKIVSKVYAAGYKLEIKDLFDHPVLKDLAGILQPLSPTEVVQEHEGAGEQDALYQPEEQPEAIREMPGVQGVFRLAPMQEGMFFHSLFNPASPAYFEQVSYRLHGNLQADLVRQSLDILFQRHEALRTIFVYEGLPQPRQVLLKEVRASLHMEDLSGFADREQRLAAFCKADISRSFDLTKGPLMRVAIIRMDAGEYAFIWSHHHIIMDGWCMGLLVAEYGEIYNSLLQSRPALLATPYAYSGYLQWLERQDRKTSLEFWRQYLQGYNVRSGIPRRAAALHKYSAAQVSRLIGYHETSGLQQLAAASRVTLNIIFQALWSAVLSKYSGCNEVVFGAVVSGRPAMVKGVAEMIGLFINTIPVRAGIRPGCTFRELFKELQQEAILAEPHHYLSLADVQQQSSLRQELLDHIFIFQNLPAETAIGNNMQEQEDDGITISDIRSFEQTSYDLNVVIYPAAEIQVCFNYNQEVYDDGLIATLADTFLYCLQQVLAAPDTDVQELQLMPSVAAHALLRTGEQAAPFAAAQCLQEQLSIIAQQYPQRVAIVQGNESITYGELEARANRLAHLLRRDYGVTPNTPVGLQGLRSPGLLAGLWAILKAGGAYVPVDPAYPAARRQYLLADSGMQVLLSDEAVADLPNGIIRVALDAAEHLALPATAPDLINSASDLAYILYTSGTTGQPKGVRITHRNVQHLAAWLSATIYRQHDRPLTAMLTASLNFDASVQQLFAPLFNGGTLVLLKEEERRDPAAYIRSLIAHKVDVLDITPSYLQAVLQAAAAAGEQLPVLYTLVGGEALNSTLIRQYYQHTNGSTLLNVYGITECTVNSACYRCTGMETGMAPLGNPLTNTRIYILDQQQQPVPRGVTGELYIGGAGVGAGYHGSAAAKQNSRFVADLLDANQHMYRTGDLGYLDMDNRLVYAGRNDEQVKIRGYRIEPAELEQTALQYPGVKGCTVQVHRDANGEASLVLYVVYNETADEAGLRSYLRQQLPVWMEPGYIIPLTGIPLTAHGKVNRQALPDPVAALQQQVYEAPATALEAQLQQIWQEVLGISRVGVTDNFFELGGHSLKAIQVLSRVRTIMQLSVELSVLFTFPDIRRLAAALNSAASQPVPPVLPVAPAAFYDVSASQQTLWLSAQLQRSAAVYNIPGAYMLHGKLDTTALEQAFRALIQRHEILRTVFPLIDGRIRQQVIPAADHHYHMPLIDLQAATEQEAQVKHWANQAASLEMDIEKGPLLHTTLLRLSAEKHLLLFTMHHLVADGWSMEVIIHDLLAYYHAFTNNLPEPLQPLKVQYKDFAAWQNQQLEGDAYEMHLQYWKNQFADTPPVLELPLDKQPNKDTPAAGTDIPFAINGATRAALEQLCRDNGITMYTLLLSAYQLLFAAITRQTDLVVATPFAGRTHPDLEPLVGPFMNTLPIRIKLLPEEKISALLQRVQQQLLEAFKHGMVTLERFAGLLNGPDTTGPHNFYQVGFTWQNTQQITGNNGPYGFEGLEVELYDTDDKYVKTTCWLHAADLGDRIQCSLLYNHALLLPETAATFTRLFLSILEMMIAAPETIATRLLSDPAFAVKRKPMSKKFSKENTFSQFLQTKTTAIQVTAPELVKITPLANGLGYPLMITPTVPGVSLLQWLQQHTGEVQQRLQETGALLFRDFEINGLADFHSFAAIIGGPPMDYMDQSSPRSRLADKVYTSTDQPSSQHINMHNELSYSRHWPLQIIFHCMQLQCTGGETPICDSRRVLAQLSPATRRRFEEKGIMYYRNLQEGFGLSWQDVYQTNDPEAVAAYCRLHNIRFSWKSEQQLQTWWVKPAIVKHPVTGEPLWFNHGLFFNERSLAGHIREGISAEELPFNTFYGDGSPIEPEVIEEIANAYAAAKVVFPWKKGDILLLDNMLMSHGRNPYDGARKIVVSMNTPCSDDMLR